MLISYILIHSTKLTYQSINQTSIALVSPGLSSLRALANLKLNSEKYRQPVERLKKENTRGHERFS